MRSMPVGQGRVSEGLRLCTILGGGGENGLYNCTDYPKGVGSRISRAPRRPGMALR